MSYSLNALHISAAVIVSISALSEIYAEVLSDDQPLLRPAPLYNQPSAFPPMHGDDENADAFAENLPISPDHGDENTMYEEVSKSSRHNKSKQKGSARQGDRDKPLAIRLEGFTKEMETLKSNKPTPNREWHDALTSINPHYDSITWHEITEKADIKIDLA